MSQLRERICNDLFISQQQLNRLILRAPHTYKVYSIPKKTGGKRIIAQPARETKYLQNWLIQNIFSRLPVHQCATAYRAGASIKVNASRHAKNTYLTKLDFRHFFTSIKSDDLRAHFSRHLADGLELDEIEDIVRISCIQYSQGKTLCLSIGAPSSPVLSNSQMFLFDSIVDTWCSAEKIAYTRYADDLTFSTNVRGLCSKIESMVRTTMRQIDDPTLTLNTRKTIHLSKKNQRRITGLVITNEGTVSIGRDKKRYISSLIHKYSIGSLDQKQLVILQGLLGFAKDVEPLFVARMRSKYGRKLITEILKIRKE